MATVQKQGRTANRNGRKLESTIEGLCRQMGCEVVDYARWAANPAACGTEVLIKNFPYTTVYGSRGSMEFYLKSRRLHYEGRVECRFQDVAGSVDEKFPYLYVNCISETHPKSTIVISEGKGARKGARSWFAQTCASAPADRSISIMSLEQFIRWFA